MFVASLRHHSANEEYVRRYLERRLSMDTFTLEYLHVMRPAIFRLSVARDIEPVVSWLRWLVGSREGGEACGCMVLYALQCGSNLPLAPAENGSCDVGALPASPLPSPLPSQRRSVGISGEELVELVRHTPAVLR